jgi:segregation and condensation protein A
MESPLNVNIEAYAGPLDLLLDLIRKQEINIYDIPISRITGQYLEYVHANIEKLDTEVAGDFLVMAATLIQIKSKMLLPPDPHEESDQEDPRQELVYQLLEHEKFKQAAAMLQQKQIVQAASWSAPGLNEFITSDGGAGDEPGLAVTLHDLVKAFQTILDRARQRPLLDIPEEQISVAEMMRTLCDMLASRATPVALKEVLGGLRSRDAAVATFLALLELVRLQAIAVRQSELFGEIELRKHRQFSNAVANLQEGHGDYR